jgi:hypothetical protein
VTACPASRRAALIVVALLCGATGTADAQSGRPIRLIPGGDAMAAPERVERNVRNDGVLAPTERDIAGILDFANGALPATLWTGSTRRALDPLLGALTAGRYATLRELTRRALASPANPPAAEPGDRLPDFAALRAAALLRLGETDHARALATRILRFQNTEETAHGVLREALFLAADTGPACEQLRATSALAAQPDWARALVVCQALEGDLARARLGLVFQREQKIPADDWLERLIAYLDGAPRALEGAKADLRPHHLPLFASAKMAPPATALATLSPAMLLALAMNPAFAIETRMRAAETATASFAADGRLLAELYASVSFQPREAADLLGFAAQEAGPRGRAALYRHVRNQASGPARASAFAQAVQVAERRGAGRAFRRAAIDLVREIPPTSEAAEHAVLIARTLLIERRTAEATRWYDILKVGAGPTDGTALLGPLLFLAGVPLPEMGSSQTLLAWRDLQARLDPPRAAARVRMLRHLMDAVGARALELEDPAEAAAAEPGSPLLAALRRAAEQRLMGETILRAAAAMAEPGLRENALAIAAAVRALTEAGLGDDGRGLALEAALAAGL